MPKKPTKNEFVPHIEPEKAPRCEAGGCKQQGMYKAPKSKNQLGEYQWLCLDHIREYNKEWDFFKGMARDEIETFMRDAVTGHRPTWNRETRTREPASRLQDALYEFLAGEQKRKRKATPNVAPKIRKALAALDLEYPVTVKELKAQYRSMVKKHHPDVNKGDKFSEEKFKKITASYHILAAYLQSGDYKG